MWLLNVNTKQLECFNADETPDYAILSHTWGEDEVTFDDVRQGCGQNKNGWHKLEFVCHQAAEGGLQYAWVDTCCIDKSSSAELSEAINSMFRWYHGAQACYALLSDVLLPSAGHGRPNGERLFPNSFNGHAAHGSAPLRMRDGGVEESEEVTSRMSLPSYEDSRHFLMASDVDFIRCYGWLARSSWFCRGWTLQEMIAPKEVYFFDKAWNMLGLRTPMAAFLSRITRIDGRVLTWSRRPLRPWRKGQSDYSGLQDTVAITMSTLRAVLDSFSVAQRMSWAAGRVTTRLEDEAYCLLGMFDVNMPMVYGEGRRAFLRLQEQIIQTSTDHSIFAWRIVLDSDVDPSRILATSPEAFMGARDIVTWDPRRVTAPFNVTNAGLKITLPLLRTRPNCCLAILNCCNGNDLAGPLGLDLRQLEGTTDRYHAAGTIPRFQVVLQEDVEDRAIEVPMIIVPQPRSTRMWYKPDAPRPLSWRVRVLSGHDHALMNTFPQACVKPYTCAANMQRGAVSLITLPLRFGQPSGIRLEVDQDDPGNRFKIANSAETGEVRKGARRERLSLDIAFRVDVHPSSNLMKPSDSFVGASIGIASICEARGSWDEQHIREYMAGSTVQRLPFTISMTSSIIATSVAMSHCHLHDEVVSINVEIGGGFSGPK